VGSDDLNLVLKTDFPNIALNYITIGQLSKQLNHQRQVQRLQALNNGGDSSLQQTLNKIYETPR
jgi:hypothetical protein